MERYTERVKEVLAQQIRYEARIVGSLVRTECYDCLILVFDDGRWACYTWYAWPEGGGGIVLSIERPEIHDLRAAGLLTEAEAEEQAAASADWWAARTERRERGELQRLRVKYNEPT